jgi:peroxiredoxin (alkyl hydroperoxide reductase subunit C)
MWNDHELSKMINGDIPCPMLSDQDGSIGRNYGIYEPAKGVDSRAGFIIDPDGNIQGFEALIPAVGRNVSENLRQIQAFQLVRQSGGKETAPAGWRPGKQTLKPGTELVGNVWRIWQVSEAFTDVPINPSGPMQ